MLEEAMTYFRNLVQEVTPVEEVDGRKYNNSGGSLKPILEPFPGVMGFSTLSGLVAWAKEQVIEIEKEGKREKTPPYFVVDSFWRVSFYGPVCGAFKQRPLIAGADHVHKPFPFGREHDTEEFIIALQAKFIMDDNLRTLLSLASRVEDKTIIGAEDNGISQTVTAKKSVATRENVTLPNPLMLKPFSTFPEIDPPAKPYVMRVKAGLKWVLYETDDTAWGVEATKRTAAWITANSEFKVYS
ncbi:MAG: hypothetical protein OEY64_03145 [Nitrospinota bacterium]|nr:hypothetical protein [Nitrospinota bacterium]